jgi:hypothetical protein
MTMIGLGHYGYNAYDLALPERSAGLTTARGTGRTHNKSNGESHELF